MGKKILVAIVLYFFLTGCETYTPSQVGKKRPTTSDIKGPLLARVNDWAIGTQDFRDRLYAFQTLYPQTDIDDPATQKKILEELVNFEILAQEARSRGMDKDSDVVKAVRNFESTFLAQKILEDLERDIIITDVEVRDFYDSNKLRLREPQQIKIREIVVGTEDRAKEIVIKLLQGESFSRLALDYSIADSKSKGGDLGYLAIDPDTTSRKFEKFWEEALTKEKGETSNYFKGPEGYYIIKVEDIRGGEVKQLREVRSVIESLLRAQKVDEKKRDLIFKAQQKFNITINEDLLD